MNEFAKFASAIFDASEHIHLIVSPTKRLLKIAFVLFVICVALLTLSSGIIMIITIPLLIFEIYFYYLFCKLWKSFRFSSLYLIIMPIAAIAVSACIKHIIYYL